MIDQDRLLKMIREQMLNPGTQWSLGTFGGIAEFSRDPGETVQIEATDAKVSAVTSRGGVSVAIMNGIRPFASESLTRQSWTHRVALCLPSADCVMSRRPVLTELGTDAAALRPEDRSGVLFDLGLDAVQVDLCIRVANEDVAARLREFCGRSIFEPGNPAMGVILAASPPRVFISRVGRVEVFQPIPPPTGKSPDGPHTHILPKLLKSGRTHPATEPIPNGWTPCAHFYPQHPSKDAMGETRAFNYAQHETFQRLADQFGLPEATGLKKSTIEAIQKELPPLESSAADRVGRTTVRITLRQLKAQMHPSRTLAAWIKLYDSAENTEDVDDEAMQQH